MLSQFDFFSQLSEAERTTVRNHCVRKSVKAREVVVTQGSRDHEMYIVQKGRLRISTLSLEGKEVGYGVLEEGDTFGEMSMLDGDPRSATITAIEPCELLELSSQAFRTLVFENPDIALNLLVILAQRLRHTTQIYEDAVSLEVPARLAQFLIQFSRSEEGCDEPVLDFKLSQYELGTLVNASRETVNKQLREWEQNGLIKSSRGKIRLLDLEALQNQAEC